MIAFLVLVVCVIYLAGTPDAHSFSELSKLDVAVISFIRTLFWLSNTGKTTSCSNKRW